MKKGIAILLLICILISVAGCGAAGKGASLTQPAEKVFSIETYHLQITADTKFEDDTGGSYDLQLTNGKCYVSIMAYSYLDLPEGVTPQDVYEMQNEDLFSKRTAVQTIEDAQTQSLPDKTVTHALYSAEREGVKNYYASYLVDIPDSETCAWVLVTAMPSYLKDNREYLHSIVCSLTSTK